MSDNSEFLSLKYYNNNKGQFEFSLIYEEQKKLFSIKILFEYINNLIEDSKYINKNNIKNLLPEEKEGNVCEQLINIDNYLVKYLDNEVIEKYNELKNLIEEDDKNEGKIINTNYVIHKLKLLQKKEENKNETINSILELNKLIFDIRNRYINYIILNSKIFNVYNFNNDTLIFIGEKYFLSEYNLKTKKFNSIITPNFIPFEDFDLSYFEIDYIFYNTIILNNKKQKFVYILEKDNNIFVIKNMFKYHLNIFEKNNYLIFDVAHDDNIEFKMFDLSNKSFIENNELTEMFNFKLSNNIPKILSFNNSNKFLLLYEKNQIGILEKIKGTKKSVNDNNKDYKRIETKGNKADISNQFLDISKEINIIKNGIVIPKVTKHSEVYYSSLYSFSPKYLFTKDNNYYCSSNDQEHFIHFDFSREYNFSYFKIFFLEKNKNCIPGKYCVELYDNDYKKINVIEFMTEEIIKEQKQDLRCIARYMHFILKKNLGGKFFIIKKIEFYSVDDVEHYQ